MQRHKIYRFFCLSLVLVAIIGCSGRWPFFSSTLEPVLAAPALVDKSISLYNIVHYRDVNVKEDFELVLVVDNKEIKMVIMGAFGQRLATVTYDAVNFDVKKEIGNRPFKFSYRQLLMDLQLIFWPETAWSGEDDAHWRIETEGLQRRFYYENVLYGVVDYDGLRGESGNYRYFNEHLDYDLLIKASLLK